jgi:hypothetical protein
MSWQFGRITNPTIIANAAIMRSAVPPGQDRTTLHQIVHSPDLVQRQPNPFAASYVQNAQAQAALSQIQARHPAAAAHLERHMR